MLTNTFIHVPQVSEVQERKLWASNIRTWDDCLRASAGDARLSHMHSHIAESVLRLNGGDHEFFSTRMLSRYHWRAYPEFKDRCCFLDIESTGLDKHSSELTIVGIYDGKESKVFIKGINMDGFPEELKKYSYIVTFNGALFDIPFIKAKFPDITLNQLHTDLRFALGRLGFRGGLKSIEKTLGIERDSDISGMTGLDAVRLWHKYKRDNDQKALDLLVRYNIEDIENLKTLMEFAYGKLKESHLCGLQDQAY